MNPSLGKQQQNNPDVATTEVTGFRLSCALKFHCLALISEKLVVKPLHNLCKKKKVIKRLQNLCKKKKKKAFKDSDILAENIYALFPHSRKTLPH